LRALALQVILDFEFPRMGLIQVKNLDQVLVDLRAGMNP
jgi:hypothetical protein